MNMLAYLRQVASHPVTAAVAALAAVLGTAGTGKAGSMIPTVAGPPTVLTTDALQGGRSFAVPDPPDQELQNITLGNAQWTVPQDLRLYEDSAFTQLSDIVRFVNVNEMGQIYFLSDTEGVPLMDAGLPPLSPGAPIRQAQETAAPITLTLDTNVGIPVRVSVFSDPNESESPGDTITVQAVPEPSSLSLASLGALTLLGWIWWRRRGAS